MRPFGRGRELKFTCARRAQQNWAVVLAFLRHEVRYLNGDQRRNGTAALIEKYAQVGEMLATVSQVAEVLVFELVAHKAR